MASTFAMWEPIIEHGPLPDYFTLVRNEQDGTIKFCDGDEVFDEHPLSHTFHEKYSGYEYVEQVYPPPEFNPGKLHPTAYKPADFFWSHAATYEDAVLNSINSCRYAANEPGYEKPEFLALVKRSYTQYSKHVTMYHPADKPSPQKDSVLIKNEVEAAWLAAQAGFSLVVVRPKSYMFNVISPKPGDDIGTASRAAGVSPRVTTRWSVGVNMELRPPLHVGYQRGHWYALLPRKKSFAQEWLTTAYDWDSIVVELQSGCKFPLDTNGLIVCAVFLQRVVREGYMLPSALTGSFLTDFAHAMLDNEDIHGFLAPHRTTDMGNHEFVSELNEAINEMPAETLFAWITKAIACSKVALVKKTARQFDELVQLWRARGSFTGDEEALQQALEGNKLDLRKYQVRVTTNDTRTRGQSTKLGLPDLKDEPSSVNDHAGPPIHNDINHVHTITDNPATEVNVVKPTKLGLENLEGKRSSVDDGAGPPAQQNTARHAIRVSGAASSRADSSGPLSFEAQITSLEASQPSKMAKVPIQPKAVHFDEEKNEIRVLPRTLPPSPEIAQSRPEAVNAVSSSQTETSEQTDTGRTITTRKVGKRFKLIDSPAPQTKANFAPHLRKKE